METKKRKPEEKVSQLCILHKGRVSKGDSFRSLSNAVGGAEEALRRLHIVRDKRLSLECGSPQRLDDVCSKIPESLQGININAGDSYSETYTIMCVE